MIWFWTNGVHERRVETRYDNDAGEFLVIITDEHGRERTERFSDLHVFRARLAALDEQMRGERWSPGALAIDPAGFPLRRSGPGGDPGPQAL